MQVMGTLFIATQSLQTRVKLVRVVVWPVDAISLHLKRSYTIYLQITRGKQSQQRFL